jgi:hypothetical protein
LIIGLLLVIAAAAAAYVLLRYRSTDQASTTAASKPALAPPAAATPLPAVTIPPLNESDDVVAGLVRQISSHPTVAAWLTTDGLIRNFAMVVWNVADGKAPAQFLRPLRPATRFSVVERGGDVYIDSRSYDRYTPLAEAVKSIDAKGAAQLYATLKPRLDEAHRELGELDTSFDRTLERAVVLLLSTPIPSGALQVEPFGTGHSFADPRLEGLTRAQKQLIRMGPVNARAVQAKLRELALAIGIPEQRLPASEASWR